MNTELAGNKPPTMAGPLVPPPPPAIGKRRQKPIDLRWLIWAGSFALGIALGVSAYQWLPQVDVYFEYWLALALG